LIGNGSGLAGLRAHLRRRAADGGPACWLLFGERNRETDALLTPEIEEWLDEGVLARADLVFSRDQPQRRYVQHVLLDHPREVVRWLAADGAIYVCGSLKGMGQEVDDALRTMLGSSVLAELMEQGRYRRDLY
jgi:sulfite reductase (NADPH) flavoprotein alpha-component